MILAHHFYCINNKVLDCQELNKSELNTEFDVSDDCQEQVLDILNEDIQKIQNLCEKYNKPIPKLMKLVYEPKTKKFNADYKYENQTTDDISVFDNYNTWFEEEKAKLEDGSEIYLLEKVINASGWFEFPSFKAACHQHGHLRTQSGKPLFNAKFGNKDGRETVFYADYKIITAYPDKGTFNYAVPEGSIFSESSLQHKAYDVDPFYPLMESLGYDFNLASDVMSWGWESLLNESAYLFGYNTEVWDVLRDEKVYKDKLESKKKEFEELRKNPAYAVIKENGFKGSGKIYPQSYIDFFIKESQKP